MKRNDNVDKGQTHPSLQESLAISCVKLSSSDRFLYKPQKPRQTAPSPSHQVCSCLDGCSTSIPLLPVAFSCQLFPETHSNGQFAYFVGQCIHSV